MDGTKLATGLALLAALLVSAVYDAVKENDPDHLVLFKVSPGYLIAEYVWPELAEHSDYAFYFCYDWKNPANGPANGPYAPPLHSSRNNRLQ
jgi:hypothetical protein